MCTAQCGVYKRWLHCVWLFSTVRFQMWLHCVWHDCWHGLLAGKVSKDFPASHKHTTPVSNNNKQQSCEMTILLHGEKSSTNILPKEKRVNRDSFGASIEQK